MAPVERIIGRRIGMERREEHVAAVPEDILRAVAVMVIHIEDRDARHAAVAGRLRGDRSGVEMAIAAQIIDHRMIERKSGGSGKLGSGRGQLSGGGVLKTKQYG